MSRGETVALFSALFVVALAVVAGVWSAHDAREYTTKRFQAAVGAGLSCQGYYGEICTKVTPVIITGGEVKK